MQERANGVRAVSGELREQEDGDEVEAGEEDEEEKKKKKKRLETKKEDEARLAAASPGRSASRLRCGMLAFQFLCRSNWQPRVSVRTIQTCSQAWLQPSRLDDPTIMV